MPPSSPDARPVVPVDSPLRGRALRVWVPGRARTKGSLRAVGTRGHMVEQVEGSGQWRSAVAGAALSALGARAGPWGPEVDWRPADGDISVRVAIWLPRPAGERYRGRRFAGQVNRNDLDKLQRNVGDALVDAQVIADDGLIVHWDAWKLWADDPWKVGSLLEVAEL